MSETLLRTPLYDAHVAAGGRLVPFAGWEMPVQYASVIAESQAVREGAGMFDVSHMARLRFVGEGLLEALENLTANDVSKLADRTGQYSLLPNAEGGTVDDIIVYRISDTEFRMVVNAANHDKDVAWIKAHLPSNIELTDYTDETVMIAVQGPTAVGILAGMAADGEAIQNAPMFGVVETQLAGIETYAVRSGYTGEDGYELICAAGDGIKLWEALVGAGVLPCGLGARDVLRVEAGLPLYGHELNDVLSPMAAGLGWVISKTKSFIGSDIINLARAQGTPTKLVGIQLHSKRLTMTGMKIFIGETEVGEISSGIYSPLLGCGAAFAFIDSTLSLNQPCTVDIRGKHEAATIVNKRFFKRKSSSAG